MCHLVKEGVGLGSARYTIAGEKLLERGWFYFKNCVNETSVANFCHLNNTKKCQYDRISEVKANANSK